MLQLLRTRAFIKSGCSYYERKKRLENNLTMRALME